MIRRLLPLFAAAALCLPTAAAAKAGFTIINLDGPGEGFNDPTPFTPIGGNHGTTLGEARLIAFQYAADILGECLNSTVPIQVEARMDPLTCTLTGAVLGTGTSKTKHRDFPYAVYAGTWYPQALANSLAGIDLAPADADIEAVFNSSLTGGACAGGAQWYYGLDGNCPSGDFDYVSVVMHELLHGSGFQTFISLSAGTYFMGYPDGYMLNMERHFFHPFGYAYLTDAERAGGNTSDPDLHWIGPSAHAESQWSLSGGTSNGHLRLHGPSPAQPGASLHHFSPSVTPSELMEPSYLGPNHDPGLAVNVLDDVGWSVANKTLDFCTGSEAVIDDEHNPPTGNFWAGGSGLTRGMFFTALSDFSICGAGIKIWDAYVNGPYLTAELYEASGTVRGPLLETGFIPVTQSAEQFHFVPFTGGTVLQECREYELVFTVGTVNGFPFYDIFSLISFPFNANGLIRPYATSDGSGVFPAPPELPLVTVVGEPAATPDQKMLLTDPGITWATCTDDTRAHGAFITADRTVTLRKLGFEAKFDSWHLGKPLRANVYRAVGILRDKLIATGTATVNSLGLVTHSIPVDAVLLEGYEYDIEIEYPHRTPYTCWLEGPGPAPFSVGGAITVRDGETAGNANALDYLLPKLTVEFDEGAGGEPHDLVGGVHHEPPTIFTNTNTDMGFFVSAINDVPVTGIGWMADVPAGEIMEMRVYQAAGTTRGALLVSESIFSTGSGMRWHDAPLSIDLVAGQEYDIAVYFGNVNSFPVYDENTAPATPFTAHGLLEIIDAEENGSAPATTDLIHVRMNLCPSSAVGVPGDPSVTPQARLLAPRPNPVRGRAVLPFSVDVAGQVTLRLFDVRGRLVSTLLDGSLPAGPGEAHLDASALAGGLYFARFTTPGHVSSRRVMVLD